MTLRTGSVAALLGATALALALSGCGPNIPAPGTAPPSDDSSPSASPSATGNVAWDDYDAGLQDRIDAAVDDGDCDALREESGEAIRLDSQVEGETGHDNAELRAYIDDALVQAECG